MSDLHPIHSPLEASETFSEMLYAKMERIHPGVADMELHEFRYALHNLYPEEGGWAAVGLETREAIEKQVNSLDFYAGIQIKPHRGERIVLDENIVRLTRMLFVGLVTGEFPVEWVNHHFYFDIRGFYFLHQTVYFTAKVLAHLGGHPFRRFEQKQKRFARWQDLGYKDFKEANAALDQCFIESIKKLIATQGTPILLALAGPTAAGKTEIVEHLRHSLEQEGKKAASIEMDNFLTDRDYREEKGIHTLGKESIHFELFTHSLEEIYQGKPILIPCYDFVYATSSHDLDGRLKPGCTPLEVQLADIIFIEGNFPFLLSEVAALIGIKVVYLTDDAVRLKRKWKRDIDYRKKYEPTYFRNRFFKDQFMMAQLAYIPQMEMCDLLVDTSGAALWATPEIAELLNAQ